MLLQVDRSYVDHGLYVTTDPTILVKTSLERHTTSTGAELAHLVKMST